ncbi:MAG: hypothetical protein RRZ84_04935 [Romboutsia sp.]
MKEQSSLGSMKDLVKQILYTESENTNTDRVEVAEIDEYGNKTFINKAGAGPEVKSRINDHYQSEGIRRKYK